MSLLDDVENIRKVLTRYSIEDVPTAAITPEMALESMERIVSVLNAAVRVVAEEVVTACCSSARRTAGERHNPTCAYQALVAALKGE